jgi:D-serine deaminase-like pyridoxal phosphate-dependent protein
MHIHELPTPALLIDLEILEKNLGFMQTKANTLGVSLRPHIKTHKSLEIGRKQLALGAQGITVSTFYEAQRFVEAGFNDITWALPLPPVYATRVLDLPDSAVIRVVIDSKEAKGHLDKVCRTKGKKLHVWLKVDCGYHRAGVDPMSAYAEELARSLAESKTLIFDGVLSHSGHSYNARRREEITPVANQERDVMHDFAERMRSKGIHVPAISIGSTPALSVIDRLDGISEVRPGNYVFYDYTQAMIGSCSVGDCALTVLTSVISHQPGASHFVTDAGALALSKDPGPTQVKNQMGLGVLFENYRRKRLESHVQLATLSQEHGKVVAENPKFLEGRFSVGERVRILEHHSCLTAANFDRYYVVDDEEVVDEWKILRGRV